MNDWTFDLHEWTNSSCTGGEAGGSPKHVAFDVASATVYSDSGLTTPQSTFGSGTTAYVTVAGLQNNKNNWNVNWVKPDTNTACSNTNGNDRPNSTSAGLLPDAAPAYLQYPPAASDNKWNDPTKYDGACPAFSNSNTGAWKLTLKKDDTHSVTLPVFSATNTANLTVNKVLNPSDDSGRFDLKIDDTTYATAVGNGGSTGAVTLSASSHTVSEVGNGTDLNNYETVFSGDCDVNTHQVSLAAGQNKTCTITNTKLATLTVVKNVVMPDGETQAEDDSTQFTFNLTGHASFSLSDSQQQTFDVQAGTYDVTEVTDPNYAFEGCEAVYDNDSVAQPEANGVQVILNAGDSVTITCTNQQKTGLISGLKWNDQNSDGKQDKGESGLADWHIQLFTDIGEPGDHVGNDAITDADGNYSFTDISPGNYFVCEVPQDNFTRTYPNDEESVFPNCWERTLSSGGTLKNLNFGNHETTPPLPVISAQSSSSVSTSSVTITWNTDHPATSRVIYDTVSHPSLGNAPNYGYTFSTIEDSTLVTSHSVNITGLSAGTTYFYRDVSHGSPEAVGSEQSFATKSPGGGGSVGTGGGGDGLGCATHDCSGNVIGGPAGGVLGVTSGFGGGTGGGVLGANFLNEFGLGGGAVEGTGSAQEATPSAAPEVTPGGETKGAATAGATSSFLKNWWWLILIIILGTIYIIFFRRRKDEN